LAYPEAGPAGGAIVIAGPHPLLGGNMHNNVVRGLGNGLAGKGFISIRFDYRGIGRSQGPPIETAKHLAEFWRTSHVSSETDFEQDLQAAVDFLRQADPRLPLALVGYSFGCSLLPSIQPQYDVAALVLVAPTLAKHNYDSFQSVDGPLLVVASEGDFALDMNALEHWFGTLTMPRHLLQKSCDNHFFRGHEDWLVDSIFQFLDSLRK
jgi:alpha/beta superfamily hydrolase